MDLISSTSVQIFYFPNFVSLVDVLWPQEHSSILGRLKFEAHDNDTVIYSQWDESLLSEAEFIIKISKHQSFQSTVISEQMICSEKMTPWTSIVLHSYLASSIIKKIFQSQY